MARTRLRMWQARRFGSYNQHHITTPSSPPYLSDLHNQITIIRRSSECYGMQICNPQLRLTASRNPYTIVVISTYFATNAPLYGPRRSTPLSCLTPSTTVLPGFQPIRAVLLLRQVLEPDAISAVLTCEHGWCALADTSLDAIH